jgi:hypothetical protein
MEKKKVTVGVFSAGHRINVKEEGSRVCIVQSCMVL